MNPFNIALLSSLWVGILFTASCANPGPPDPVKSQTVEVLGGGFSMKRDNRSNPFSGGITFKLRDGVSVPAYGTVIFENPSDSTRPFTKNVVFRRPGEEIAVNTPSFPRIANNRRYWVTLDLYSDSAKTRKIDSLRQENQFSVPPAIVYQLGLGDKVD